MGGCIEDDLMRMSFSRTLTGVGVFDQSRQGTRVGRENEFLETIRLGVWVGFEEDSVSGPWNRARTQAGVLGCTCERSRHHESNALQCARRRRGPGNDKEDPVTGERFAVHREHAHVAGHDSRSFHDEWQARHPVAESIAKAPGLGTASLSRKTPFHGHPPLVWSG
jgi:hypothetical protein